MDYKQRIEHMDTKIKVKEDDVQGLIYLYCSW
jgi:hypothetical protein